MEPWVGPVVVKALRNNYIGDGSWALRPLFSMALSHFRYVSVERSDGIAHMQRLACLVPYRRQRAEFVTLDPTATADVCTA